MSFSYGEFKNILKSDTDIKEIFLIEGEVIRLGILEELKEPIFRNGRKIDKAIGSYRSFGDYGTLNREECINVLKGFQEGTDQNLYPNKKNTSISYTNKNDCFRITVMDNPISKKLIIQYRKFEYRPKINASVSC